MYARARVRAPACGLCSSACVCVCVCVCVSTQIGALTMDLIDLETKRTEHRAQEEGISPSMVAQKALEASQGSVTLNDR